MRNIELFSNIHAKCNRDCVETVILTYCSFRFTAASFIALCHSLTLALESVTRRQEYEMFRSLARKESDKCLGSNPVTSVLGWTLI